MLYETISGDTWDSIALFVYGDENHADWLMQNNPFLLGTMIFASGTYVYIPDLPVSDSDTGESGSDNISNNGKEGNTMTLEEFLKENPGEQAAVDAMVASAKEDGVQEERKRIMELDDIAKSVTQEALNNAKYGEKTMDAKELSFQVMKDDSLKAASYMKDAVEDSKESGVKDVGVGSCKEDEEVDEAAEAAAYVNKLKGKGVK